MSELEEVKGAVFRGIRTPDGPMVMRFDPPSYEAVALPEANLDWGKKNRGAFELARFLLSTVGRQSLPGKGSKELLDEVVQYLDQRGFVISAQEIKQWRDNIPPPPDNIDVYHDSGL